MLFFTLEFTMKYILFLLRIVFLLFVLISISFICFFAWILEPKQVFRDVKNLFLDVRHFLTHDHPFK